jgi:hypothetical protein
MVTPCMTVFQQAALFHECYLETSFLLLNGIIADLCYIIITSVETVKGEVLYEALWQ